jgi:hypothetical protein
LAWTRSHLLILNGTTFRVPTSERILARAFMGTRPGDLPVTRPDRFDFIVNAKTAREPRVAVTADEAACNAAQWLEGEAPFVRLEDAGCVPAITTPARVPGDSAWCELHQQRPRSLVASLADALLDGVLGGVTLWLGIDALGVRSFGVTNGSPSNSSAP